MKKLIAIFAFLGFLGHKSIAQESSTFFGLKVAMSSFDYYGSDWDSIKAAQPADATIKSKINITGALAVNSHLGEWVVLKHEFWFSNKGGIIERADGSSSNYNRFYMDLAPVLIGANLKGCHIFAGPQAGLLMYLKDKETDATGTVTTFEDQEGFSVLDYGFMAGIEYEFPFGLNVGTRYIQGIRALDEDNKTEWYNKGWYFSLGYTFGKNL